MQQYISLKLEMQTIQDYKTMKLLPFLICSLLICGCKSSNLKPAIPSTHDKIIIRGYLAFVTYKPYKLHKFKADCYLYKMKGTSTQKIGKVKETQNQYFEIELEPKDTVGVDSLDLHINYVGTQLTGYPRICVKDDYNLEPLAVILQPSCLCQYDSNGQLLEKYSNWSRIPHTGETIYPYTRYRYKCVVDQEGKYHNFEDVAEDVKEAIEEVEKKQKK